MSCRDDKRKEAKTMTPAHAPTKPPGNKTLIGAITVLTAAVTADVTLRQSSRTQDSVVEIQLKAQSTEIAALSGRVSETNVLLGRFDERLKNIERRTP